MTDPWVTVNDTQPTLQPSCRSTTSTPRLEPTGAEGWSFEEAPGDKFYWSSSSPGARITFSVYTAEGRLGMFFLRSRKLGLGDARCWLDGDDSSSVVVVGYWDKEESVSQYTKLAADVSPGEHELTCEVAATTKDPGGGHAFKIIGLAMA